MRCDRSGLTLIEVLAASVLLGSLLATAVVAASRHTQQIRRAQDRLAAIKIADGLLRAWLIDGQGLIEATAGPVAGHDGWQWQITSRMQPELQLLGCHVAMLQIVDRSPRSRFVPSESNVLATVEFVSSSAVTAPETF